VAKDELVGEKEECIRAPSSLSIKLSIFQHNNYAQWSGVRIIIWRIRKAQIAISKSTTLSAHCNNGNVFMVGGGNCLLAAVNLDSSTPSTEDSINPKTVINSNSSSYPRNPSHSAAH
jgi:hypothetical protein